MVKHGLKMSSALCYLEHEEFIGHWYDAKTPT